MENVRQFAFHDRVSKTKPTHERLDAYMEKLNAGGTLTRDEKDALVGRFYGAFGQRDGARLKYMGWVWDFTSYTKEYLVYQYGQWHSYRAFDKTSLRKAIYGRVDRIVEA